MKTVYLLAVLPKSISYRTPSDVIMLCARYTSARPRYFPMESAINTSPRRSGIVRNIGTREIRCIMHPRSSKRPHFSPAQRAHVASDVSYLHVSFGDWQDFRGARREVKDCGRSAASPPSPRPARSNDEAAP